MSITVVNRVRGAISKSESVSILGLRRSFIDIESKTISLMTDDISELSTCSRFVSIVEYGNSENTILNETGKYDGYRVVRIEE